MLTVLQAVVNAFLWVVGNLRIIVPYLAQLVTTWGNSVWSFLRAAFNYTSVFAAWVSNGWTSLWDTWVRPGFSSLRSIATQLPHLVIACLRPAIYTLEKGFLLAVSPLAVVVFLVIGAAIEIAKLPSRVRAPVLAWANTLENHLVGRLLVVQDAFGFFRDKVNAIAAWLNFLFLPNGELNVGVLLTTLIRYQSWWWALSLAHGLVRDPVEEAARLAGLFPVPTPATVVARIRGGSLAGQPAADVARAALLRVYQG